MTRTCWATKETQILNWHLAFVQIRWPFVECSTWTDPGSTKVSDSILSRESGGSKHVINTSCQYRSFEFAAREVVLKLCSIGISIHVCQLCDVLAVIVVCVVAGRTLSWEVVVAFVAWKIFKLWRLIIGVWFLCPDRIALNNLSQSVRGWGGWGRLEWCAVSKMQLWCSIRTRFDIDSFVIYVKCTFDILVHALLKIFDWSTLKSISFHTTRFSHTMVHHEINVFHTT